MLATPHLIFSTRVLYFFFNNWKNSLFFFSQIIIFIDPMGLAHGQNPSTPYYRSKKPIELLGQLKNRAEARIKTRAKAQTARSGLTKTGAKEAWEETRVRILLISPPRVARLDLTETSSHSRRNLPPTTSFRRSSKTGEPPTKP